MAGMSRDNVKREKQASYDQGYSDGAANTEGSAGNFVAEARAEAHKAGYDLCMHLNKVDLQEARAKAYQDRYLALYQEYVSYRKVTAIAGVCAFLGLVLVEVFVR